MTGFSQGAGKSRVIDTEARTARDHGPFGAMLGAEEPMTYGLIYDVWSTTTVRSYASHGDGR